LAQYNNHKDENVRKVVASAHDVLHRAAEHMKGRAKTVKAKHIYSLISEHHKAKAGSSQGSSNPQAKKKQSKEQYHASLSQRMKAKVEKFADKIHDDLDRGYDLDHDENTSKMSRFAHAASKQSADSKSPLVHRRLAAMHHAARDAHWRLYKKWGDKDNMKQYKLHDERAKAHIEAASSGASKDSDLSKSISVSLLKAKKRKGEAGMVLKKVQTKSGKMVNRWVKQGSEAPKSKKRIKSSSTPSKRKEKNSKAMKTKTKKTIKTKKAKKESNFHALQLELDKVTRNPENRRRYTDKLNWKLLDSALKEGDPTVVSRALTHIREVLK